MQINQPPRPRRRTITLSDGTEDTLTRAANRVVSDLRRSGGQQEQARAVRNRALRPKRIATLLELGYTPSQVRDHLTDGGSLDELTVGFRGSQAKLGDIAQLVHDRRGGTAEPEDLLRAAQSGVPLEEIVALGRIPVSGPRNAGAIRLAPQASPPVRPPSAGGGGTRPRERDNKGPGT